MRRHENRRGQAILGTLMMATLLAVVAMGLASGLAARQRAGGKAAAQEAIRELSQSLVALLGSRGCEANGKPHYELGGISPVAVVQMAGSGYSLSVDTLKFASGEIAVTARRRSDQAKGGTRVAVRAIELTPTARLASLGGAGASQYPFQMNVKFESGNGTGAPPADLVYRITVHTDVSAGNVVVGACLGEPALKSPTLASPDFSRSISAMRNFVREELASKGIGGVVPRLAVERVKAKGNPY